MKAGHYVSRAAREYHGIAQDLQSTTRLAELWMLQILDTRMGFPTPSCNVVIIFMPRDGMIGGILFVSCMFVCLSVCCQL